MSPRAVRFSLLGLLLLFVASRVYHLMLLPVFIDESLHVYWPVRLFEKGRFLRHFADGKSLQIWILHPIMKLASDAPWAARFVSVLIGAAGMCTAWALGRRLATPAAGVAAALLYAVSPFTLFYDRMALADIYVSTFAALTLLASVRLAEAPSLGRSAALGLALSACVLSKMTGLIFFFVPMLAAWELQPRAAGIWKSVAAAYAFAGTICLFPVLHFFGGFRPWTRLVGMVSSWLGSSAPAHGAGRGHENVIIENLWLGAGWLLSYWTAPLLLLGIAGLVVGLWKRERGAFVLAFGAVAPVVAFSMVSSHWFSRYIVCTAVPFAVLAGRFFAGSMARLAGARAPLLAPVVLLLLAMPALRFDRLLLTDPPRAPLPAGDRYQYVDGWSSGYGTAEAARYLLDQAAKHPQGIRVVTDRLGQRAIYLILRAYALNAPGLKLQEEDLRDPSVVATLSRAASLHPVYVAQSREQTEDERFSDTQQLLSVHERVLSCRKPTGEAVLDVYRLRAAGGAGN